MIPARNIERVPRRRGDEPPALIVAAIGRGGVPRRRGDEPSYGSALLVQVVFPAGAGMNRSRLARLPVDAACSPQARG